MTLLIVIALLIIATCWLLYDDSRAAPKHYGHPQTWFNKHAPDSAKQRILEGRVKHATDVARFFANHPRLARTERGRNAAWQHRRMGRWAQERLGEVRSDMRRAVVVRRLERALRGTPMEGSGRALERAAFRHRISPFFIVAIAATESSIGHAACSGNRKNVWGLSSCGSGWHVPQFRSWGEAYSFFARFLTDRWPSATTAHHYYGYAACSSCWGRKTAAWMRSLFGVGDGVRYP